MDNEKDKKDANIWTEEENTTIKQLVSDHANNYVEIIRQFFAKCVMTTKG